MILVAIIWIRQVLFGFLAAGLILLSDRPIVGRFTIRLTIIAFWGGVSDCLHGRCRLSH